MSQIGGSVFSLLDAGGACSQAPGAVHSVPAGVAEFVHFKGHHADKTKTTETTDDLDDLGQLGDARRCPEGGPSDAHQAAEKQPATPLDDTRQKLISIIIIIFS